MAGTGKAHLRDGDRVLSVEDLTVEFNVVGRFVVGLQRVDLSVASCV